MSVLVHWWPQAVRFLAEDDVLGRVVRATPETEGLAACTDLMRTYVRTVCGQQVSAAAAANTAARVFARAGETAQGELARRLAALSLEALAAAGLTKTKATALGALARGYCEGRLDAAGLSGLADDEIRARWCAIPGIGPWSADMMMIFGLNRPDVAAWSDYGVKKALEALGATDAKPSRFSPFGTAATWFLWRSRNMPQQY